MDVLLFCHTQIWLRSPCCANVSLFVWFRSWANITHKKEIASVHFNDLFSAWFIYNDLNKNLSLIYEDLQKKSKQMSGHKLELVNTRHKNVTRNESSKNGHNSSTGNI